MTTWTNMSYFEKAKLNGRFCDTTYQLPELCLFCLLVKFSEQGLTVREKTLQFSYLYLAKQLFLTFFKRILSIAFVDAQITVFYAQ